MKRAVFAAMSTLAGLVMLLSFKTVPLTTASTATSAPSTASSSPTTGSGSSSATEPSTTTSSGSSSSATATTAAQTVTGQSVSTRYGDVQVQITYSGTKITDVTPVTLPSDNPRDVQINAAAIPVLEQEAVSAQSADIDMVSGATYTSQGYIESLQSALDQVPALSNGQG